MANVGPPVMMIGDGDGGGLVVVVGGRWWSHGPPCPPYSAPPRAPRTMGVFGSPQELLTDTALDSFKYYNFWLAKMSVRGFFSTSLARNAHGQCF